MRLKATILTLSTLIVAAIIAIAAQPPAPAGAFPSENSTCSSCHPNSTLVNVSVSQVNATTWSYAITGASGSAGFGVFNSSGQKVASGSGLSGSFSIPGANGTYTFYGVRRYSGMQGSRSTQFSAAAPTATPTNTPLPPTPTRTNTPLPAATNTPVPGATNTPVPAATNTPAPAATNTPVPAATNTPVGNPSPSGTGPSAVIGTKHDLGSAGSAACLKCHTPHDAAGTYLWSRAVGAGAGIQPLCYSCHDGSVTSVGKYAFNASLSQHTTTPGVKGADCDRCHDPHVGTFKFTNLAQTNANLCQSCHGKAGADNHPVDVAVSTSPTDRVWNPNLASPDFAGTRLYDVAGTAEVTGGQGYVKCLTCHASHGGTGGTKLTTMAPSSATNSSAPLCQNCHK